MTPPAGEQREAGGERGIQRGSWRGILLQCELHYNSAHITPRRCEDIRLALEDRTARLTVLIDPRKKALFERLCAERDTTPSQVVRQLIRRYIEEQTGEPWSPKPPAKAGATAFRQRIGLRPASAGPR